MDNYLYLILNLSSIALPFAFSFEHRVQYFRQFNALLPGILCAATLFIIHDIFFTRWGIWGFNSNYLIGKDLLGLPIEEWLFFICIPYCSLFIHYCKEFFSPQLKLSPVATKFAVYTLLFFLLTTSILNSANYYTISAFILAAILIGLAYYRAPELLSSFLVSYVFILLPFFIINGILTGSFIVGEVVWYNDNHNLGIRMGTIPFEDMFYGFSLLFIPLYIDREIKLRNNNLA